jgi:hypothetical protein
MSWSPTEVSGLEIWLDATDASTFTLSGSNVTQWRDKTGNAYHFDPSAPAALTRGADGSRTVVTFKDGADYNNSTVRCAKQLTFNTNTYFFWVCKVPATTSYPFYWFLTQNEGSGGAVGALYQNAALRGGPGDNTSNPFGWGGNNYLVNGTRAVTPTYTNYNVTGFQSVYSGTTSSFAIGSWFNYTCQFRGSLCELLVYKPASALTTADRQKVEGYLAWKWGTQDLLPAGHLYVNNAPSNAPASPTISVATVSSRTAKIFFTPGDNGGSAITGYKYSLNNGEWSSTTLSPVNESGGGQSITITGLTNGVTYSIRIRAINSAGDGTISSAVGSLTPTSPFIATLPSGISTVGLLSSIQSLGTTISAGQKVALSTIAPITSLSTDNDKKAARESIVNMIFEENSGVTSFKTSFSDLGLTAAVTRSNVDEAVVLKSDPSGNPTTLDSLITPTTALYTPLTNIGDKNTLTYKSTSFTLEKTGANSYKFIDASGAETTYSTGGLIVYNDLTIKFGGSATIYTTNIPIVVNLDVLVDASGNINVFGATAPVVSNVIVAQTTLPVNTLYDASGTYNVETPVGVANSLFEFWEPSSAIGTRQATKCVYDVASGKLRDYTSMTQNFVRKLQIVLEGSFDCSASTPFNDPKYSGNENYTSQPNFGRLALSSYSHYLFGHVAATSAVTNDQAFMNAMLSQSLTDGSGNPMYKFKVAKVGGLADGSQWVPGTIGTAADADLARLLVGAIVNKNDSAILAIVEQVLGQDASRAMDQDNNQLAPDVRQPLKFIQGDVIYMNIRLKQPIVSVGGGQQVSSGTLQGKFPSDPHTETNYTLKITLENKA